MKVQWFYIGLITARYKHGRCKILCRIARDDGHKGVEVDAASKDGYGKDAAGNAQYFFSFHMFELS